MSFIAELKRRNVFRVGIAYVISCWLALQGLDFLLDIAGTPDWVIRTLGATAIVGLPIVLIFAWAFEMTPEGLKKEKDVDRSQSITHQTGRKLDFVIIAVLALAVVYFLVDKFALQPGLSETTSVSPQAEVERVAEAVYVDIPEKSIAVLPFVNMSNDPEQDYFSDGISEELLNVLAKFPGMQVAARTSSFQFKGQNRDIGEIAKTLKVMHVLEGSVRKAGNQLRITAQLIRADSGYHLWSETYDRELDDVFAIQDEISRAIGEAMRVELALEGQSRSDTPRVAETSNTDAYQAFLKGRHLVNQRGRRNLYNAVDQLERSVRLDADYAPAHAWLAIAHGLLLASPQTYGDYTMDEMIRRAQPHIDRALELDPDLGEAWGAKGLLELSIPDNAAGIASTTRALELNPAFVEALIWRTLAYDSMGNWEQSVEGYNQILKIDPLTVIGRMNQSVNISVTEPEKARAVARSLIEQNAWAGYSSLGRVEVFNGHVAEGIPWMLMSYREDPTDDFANSTLVYGFLLVGLNDEARRLAGRLEYAVDATLGRWEESLHLLQGLAAADPDNIAVTMDWADTLYRAGREQEAFELYERISRNLPADSIYINPNDNSTRSMVRQAHLRKKFGDHEGADQLVNLVRQDYRNRERWIYVGVGDRLALAMTYALEGNEQKVLEILQEALDAGMRDTFALDEPLFAAYRENPDLLALVAQIDRDMDAQRAKVLQLICHDNPVIDTWKPLPRTCLGVTDISERSD